MGPVAHARRMDAMEALTADAVSHGAKVACGGERIGNRGYFFAPTVLMRRSHGCAGHERGAVRAHRDRESL